MEQEQERAPEEPVVAAADTTPSGSTKPAANKKTRERRPGKKDRMRQQRNRMRAELSSLGSSTDSGEGKGDGFSSGTVASLLPPFTGGRVETAANTTPPHAGGHTLANIEKNNPVLPPPAGGSSGASSSGSGSMPPPSGGVPKSRKRPEPSAWVLPFGIRPGATSTPRPSTPYHGGHGGGGSSDLSILP